MAKSAFRDILRSYLGVLRKQLDAGDFTICFGTYQPLQIAKPVDTSDSDLMQSESGLFVSQAELLYSRMVNKYAGKQIMLSIIVADIERILQTQPPIVDNPMSEDD